MHSYPLYFYYLLCSCPQQYHNAPAQTGSIRHLFYWISGPWKHNVWNNISESTSLLIHTCQRKKLKRNDNSFRDFRPLTCTSTFHSWPRAISETRSDSSTNCRVAWLTRDCGHTVQWHSTTEWNCPKLRVAKRGAGQPCWMRTKIETHGMSFVNM